MPNHLQAGGLSLRGFGVRHGYNNSCYLAREEIQRLAAFVVSADRDLIGLELRQRPNERISHREPNTRDGGLAFCLRFLISSALPLLLNGGSSFVF